MKRIKAACLEQTIQFQLKDGISAELAKQQVLQEYESYKAQMDCFFILYAAPVKTVWVLKYCGVLHHKAALVPCGGHRIGFLVVPHFIGGTIPPASPGHSCRDGIQSGGRPVRSPAVWPGLERDALAVHAVNAPALSAADFSAGVWHITPRTGVA